MSEEEKDSIIEWLADTATHERVMQVKRVVKPDLMPYYLLLLLAELHEFMWFQTDDEEDDEEEAEPWKT